MHFPSTVTYSYIAFIEAAFSPRPITSLVMT